MSPTTATWGSSRSATTTDTTTRAVAIANSLSRVRRMARMRATVTAPTRVVATSMWWMFTTMSAAFATLFS